MTRDLIVTVCLATPDRKGGSRQWQIEKSDENPKAPLGGSGGMPPQEIFDIFVL